jgi:hypothetical protein
MKFAFLLSRTTWNSVNWSFDQAVYSSGSISIAQSNPQIREAYLNVRQSTTDVEIFLLYAKEDFELLNHYLPELPLDNYFPLNGDYDIFSQLKKVSEICSSFDQPYAPIVVIPINHVVFSPRTYHNAIKIGLALAERSGDPFLLGNFSKPNSPQGTIVDEGNFIERSELSVAPLKSYSYGFHHNEDASSSMLSYDCGLLCWRAAAMSSYLELLETQIRGSKPKFTTLGELYTQTELPNSFVIKGEYGWFDPSLVDEQFQVVQYGSPDRNGKIYLGDIKPPQFSDLGEFYSRDRDDYLTSSLLSNLANSMLSIDALKRDIKLLEVNPAFSEVVAAIKKRFGLT